MLTPASAGVAERHPREPSSNSHYGRLHPRRVRAPDLQPPRKTALLQAGCPHPASQPIHNENCREPWNPPCYRRRERLQIVEQPFPSAMSAPEQSLSRTSTGDGWFKTTHWTVVLTAREKDGAAARGALASLCSTYWYPLYAFIRRQGSSPHEAEDLTQEFFFRFLERHSLGSVQPAAGKFRSFLLACLKNFLANERERANAQRRGSGQSLVPLDSADAETRYSLEPADSRTPEAVFERRWALAVLERTMQDLRREYSAGQKRELFGELQGFLPGGQGNVSRAELAAKRGVSVGAIDVAVHRLRQRFGASAGTSRAHGVLGRRGGRRNSSSYLGSQRVTKVPGKVFA